MATEQELAKQREAKKAELKGLYETQKTTQARIRAMNLEIQQLDKQIQAAKLIQQAADLQA